jgi:hypothetical protein
MGVFLILDPNGVENGKLIKNTSKHEMRNNQFSERICMKIGIPFFHFFFFHS